MARFGCHLCMAVFNARDQMRSARDTAREAQMKASKNPRRDTWIFPGFASFPRGPLLEQWLIQFKCSILRVLHETSVQIQNACWIYMQIVVLCEKSCDQEQCQVVWMQLTRPRSNKVSQHTYPQVASKFVPGTRGCFWQRLLLCAIRLLEVTGSFRLVLENYFWLNTSSSTLASQLSGWDEVVGKP